MKIILTTCLGFISVWVSAQLPEIEFCTYNLDLLYGETFNIRDYAHYKDDPNPVDWSQMNFTYTEVGANDPTIPTDWNLTAFNNGNDVTVSAADNQPGSGNHGQGRYRVYIYRQGQTEFDDFMTIRVENMSSTVIESQCGNSEPCILYAHIGNNNCCQPCPTGNLKVKMAHWLEDYTNLISANVALNKPSIFEDIPNRGYTNAHVVTDGKFEDNINNGLDYAASDFGDNPWWDLDLIGNYDLEQIIVHGRTTCCQTTVYDYRIFTSQLPFLSEDPAVLATDPNVWSTSQTVTGGNPFTVNLNQNARFVRIQLAGTGRLQLSEVEVIGSGNANSNPYNYTWSDPNIGNTAYPTCLSSGNYCVTVGDDATGCEAVVCKNVN